MSMETMARHGLALLLDASLRSLLLLAISGTALLCLCRSSAAARHLVLLLTLAGLLLLPLLSSALPGWQVRLWPRAASALSPVFVATSPSMPESVSPPTDGTASSPSVVITTPKSDAALPSAVAMGRKSHPVPWPLYGFALWLIGTLAVLTPVVTGLICVRRIERRSLRVTAESVTGLAAELGRQLGIRQTVMLRQSGGEDALAMPMTWGWRRPVILLPSDATDWPTERLRVVLLHELAHVRRGDWLWQMLAHLSCALYWFQPGVWLVARGLRAESERACDDQVLSAGIPAPDYARHLVDVARTLSAPKTLPSVAVPMAEVSQVGGRVRDILCTERKRKMATRQNILAATALTLGLLLPLASLQPVSGYQKSPVLSPPALAQKPLFAVVVDAGHGAQDTGSIGIDGTYEKDINLAIATKLQETLTKDGVRVIMTRTDDTFLSVMARPAFVEANHAQYFISIHCDNHEPANSHSGLTAYYHVTSTTGHMLASDVLHHIARDVVSPARSILSDTTRFPRNGFGVLRGSPVPAVLIDCGYMNNAHDLKALHQEQTQQKIADGIAAGLIKFDTSIHPYGKRRIMWPLFMRTVSALYNSGPHL